MWHTFFVLPLMARIIALAGGVVLVFYAVIKAKAIDAAMKKTGEAASLRFWKWVHKKATLGHPQDSNAKTYRGVFQDYWYTSTPRPMNFFSLSHDHVTTMVQILDTNLLARLKRGTSVEIDAEAVPGYEYEIVRRVRVHETQAS